MKNAIAIIILGLTLFLLQFLLLIQKNNLRDLEMRVRVVEIMNDVNTRRIGELMPKAE